MAWQQLSPHQRPTTASPNLNQWRYGSNTANRSTGYHWKRDPGSVRDDWPNAALRQCWTSIWSPSRLFPKGKVIYPDVTKSEEDLSRTILMISALDKSKPSLVVMGTRVGAELRNLHHQYPYAVRMMTWMVSTMYAVSYQSLQWVYRVIIRPALPPSRPPSHQD